MPPLFVCCFDNVELEGDRNPLLVDAENWEAAAARVLEETGETPLTVHPAPSGLLCAEVRFANDETEDNPADAAAEGIALEPYEAFCDWLHDIDNAEPPPAELAATQEAPGGSDAL